MDADAANGNGFRMQIYRPRLTALLDEEDGRGISNAQVAEEIGVPSSTLNKWKLRGSMPQDPWQFMLLCHRLHTHPNYLIGWSDDRYPPRVSEHGDRLDAEIAKNRREAAAGKKR